MKNYERKYIRAPLRVPILFTDDEYVYLGKIRNLSEGGILIEELPVWPKINIIGVLISLPNYPLFDHYSLNSLEQLQVDSIPRRILRCRVRTVRKTKDKHMKDLFSGGIGGEFPKLESSQKRIVNDYVERSVHNISYMMTLLEKGGNASELNEIARILDFPAREKLVELKEDIKAAYQNLRW